MKDGALAERVRAGDRAAFAELYGQYSERIFGFCVVLLHDADEAADAMHDAFVLALQRVTQLRDPERLTAWLFAVARHVCYRRLRQRQRAAPAEIAADAIVLDEDPSHAVSIAELTELVHTAAAGLSDRDREVLYLGLMEGVEGPDLAAAVGASYANPYSLLHRAKAQLQRAIGIVVVARFGRRACAPLAGMLEDWDGTLTPLMRKRLARHVDGCAACQATQARVLPASVLATIPVFGTTVLHDLASVQQQGNPHEMSVRDARLSSSSSPAQSPSQSWRRDGFPPAEHVTPRRRRLLLFVAAAIVLFLAIVLGGALTSGRHPGVAVVTPPAPAPAPLIRVDAKQVIAATTTSTTRTTTTTVAGPPVSSHAALTPGAPPTAGSAPPVASVGPPDRVVRAPVTMPRPPVTAPTPKTTVPEGTQSTIPEASVTTVGGT